MSTTPTPCCQYCGATTYIYPIERDFWSCGSKVNANDDHERSTQCRKAETARLKCEIAIQKRLRADDVAELNARLIQRREDYAAHSVKREHEIQALQDREAQLREALVIAELADWAERNYQALMPLDERRAGARIEMERTKSNASAQRKAALSQPAPPVVPVADVAPLMNAGRKVIETNSDGGDIAEAFHELDMAMREFNHKHPGI